MKRLALLLAASVAAVTLFTACPNKPLDDMPVAIPDGTYRETCECVYSISVFEQRGDTLNVFEPVDFPMYDTVEVINGNFYYNPCDDTTFWGGYTLIYDAPYYCKTGRFPVYVTEDGYAHFDSVHLWIPFDSYKSTVHKYMDGYRFENKSIRKHFNRDGYLMKTDAYKFIHTLNPIR